MAYIYRHIRLDKNEPFYIGIGSDDDYLRAKSKLGRNKYWQNIINRTEYEVEIILDDLNWKDACKKEIEFISIYKRKKDGGTLANLTLGGEGQLGMTPWNFGKETSEDTKKKQSLKKIGKPPPNKGKPMPINQLKRLIAINKGRTPWNKGKSPRKETIEKRNATMLIVGYKKGESHHQYGKKMPPHTKEKLRIANEGRPPWNKGTKMTEEKIKKSGLLAGSNKKNVLQFDSNMNFIKQFNSLNDAFLSGNYKYSTLSKYCSGKIKGSYFGFFWAYKKQEGKTSP